MTHSFCFATCTNGLSNTAPGADESAVLDVGGFSCDEGNGLTKTSDVRNDPIMISPTGFQTSGPKTAAVLIMHGIEANQYMRVFRQANSIMLNGEPFPAARISVGQEYTSQYCRLEAMDVFSTTEFVLVVVTANGTSLRMYKNGIQLGSESCSYTPVANSEPFTLSEFGGYGFMGTIKSFAMWDRALSDAEVAGLDATNLTC